MAEGWIGVSRREGTTVEHQKHPWKFACPQMDCFYNVCADTEQDALGIEKNHPCPWQGGPTKIGWTITVSLVQQVWDKLDADMVKLMQPEANTDFVALKARMRAFAEVLAIFMNPHFTTADEIAREAKKRYDNRDGEYETAGLGIRRYEGPPGDNKYAPTPMAAGSSRTRRTAPRKEVVVQLGDKEQTAIRFAADSGMMTVQDIARTYGVSEEVINKIITV